MVSDYPKATEAGIDVLMAAEKKYHGSPPHNLTHAKEILGIAEPKPDYSSPYLSALAWERKYLRARWEDTELALHASWREHKALGEKPNQYGFPGVPALVLSLSLAHAAGHDMHMTLCADDLAKGARAVIRAYLATWHPSDKAN
jgi:hypothetical protein